MKIFKQITLLLTGLLVVVISCKKTESVTPANLLPVKKFAQANSSAAEVYQVEKNIDLSISNWVEYNACTGQNIKVVEGIWRIKFKYITNGNRFTFSAHSTVSAYKLIDETTGIEYTGSYITNESFTGNNSGEFPVRITGTSKILLNTPGGKNNGKLIANYTFTINANGEVTADLSNFRAGCQ